MRGSSNWQSSALSGPSEAIKCTQWVIQLAIKCTQWAIRGNQVHSVGHPIGNQVHSVGHQRQSSALSGPSEAIKCTQWVIQSAIKCTQWAIRGNQVHSVGHPIGNQVHSVGHQRQSSALTFHTTRWLLSDLMREAIRGHHPRSSSRQMLSDLMSGAIRQVISGNQSMAMRATWGYLQSVMRLRIRGDVTKREQSGRPLVEIT